MKRQRLNNKGFTLIETTVAMLVMMVVGLGATSLFLYSVRYNSGASQRSVAMAVAQERLEALRGADFDAAGLAYGTHAPVTVVIAPATTSGYTSAESAYDAPVTATSFSATSNPNVNPNRPPTPTPTPTPGGGGGGGTTGAPAGSTFYRVNTQVVAFPIGADEDTATQKQITIRVEPINGSGSNAWANQNPVQIVFRRSMGTSGPYKQ